MLQDFEYVQTAVRCRPPSTYEKEDSRATIVEISTSQGKIMLTNPKDDYEPSKTFAFDKVFDWDSTQETVYRETAYPIVESVLEGYNGTILAFGQTGMGKTYTIEGKPESEELRGIIPRAFEQVFKHIEGAIEKQFLVHISFVELEDEEIRDLLSDNPKKKLELKENPETGVYVKDIMSFPVRSIDEMQEKFRLGIKNRALGETESNRGSAYSHSIFSITIEASKVGPDGENHITMGKLNLVDLAGSERRPKQRTDRFADRITVGPCYTFLNVIAALTDPKCPHIPYRDSKLTKLLKDSLGGNAKTVMIGNIGPADWSFDETLSTLRYVNRAKNIKNKPKINEDPEGGFLREFQEEANKLKNQLEQLQGEKISGEFKEKELSMVQGDLDEKKEREQERAEDFAKEVQKTDQNVE